ncbi:NAD-dependent epimerase/dehydratase family protein [Clostridium sp. D2Q-11]|uniref:NAD-dependent epimerase/dehydratase family protein n=1 Tax=Anaeromonas frigoriresistens TaxID=2683708 RepID=A0A942V559_9FIRM|nr:NAD-dependent epimerase/dehydratase family protein [Anaeromonas frigoriresistens]MBS4540062.1 NAD-dependent epimerase/dehydratase family protein [Anaeromonas frigoriresistens]
MILVTGASGFIGSKLCEALLHHGHKVLGVDNFYHNYDKWIKEFNIKNLLGDPDFIFLENNILDPSMKQLIEGLNIESVIHLADIPGVNYCSEVNFDEYIKYNIVATQRILEAIKNKGVKKFIYASSSTVYGETGILPMSEITNPRPISLYGVSKLAGESLATYYGNGYDIDIINLRFFTTYGPHQRPDMAFHKFIKSILLDEDIIVYGDGKQRRDFVYVEDVVDSIVHLLQRELVDEIINIGEGYSLSVNDSISIIENMLNKKGKIVYTEPLIEEQINTKACTNLYEKIMFRDKKTDIEKGINREIKYIKQLYNI